MGLVEVILIIVGAVVLSISFVVPAGRAEKDAVRTPEIDEKMIKDLVDKEISNAKSHINDMVDETLSYSMEKTERAMERLTNEKIMAINEYSEQVLTAINKNHQEVMFLYDMLNDKHENLVNTVSEAARKAKEIRQTVKDAEITVKEAAEMIAGDVEAAAGKADGMENTAENRNGQAKSQKVELQKVNNGNNRNNKSDIGNESNGNPGSKEMQVPENSGNAEAESMGQAGDSEFVPIAPKRVEVLYGMMQEEASGTEGVMETAFEPEPEQEEERNGNNNDKILRLYQLGKSKTAIAKELGLGVGEVKLVIDLFNQE